MFINRRRDRIKIIWWDGDGLAISMKRLERGTVQKLTSDDNSNSLLIDQRQLAMLLTGIDVSNIKRRKRYQFTPQTLTKLCS